MLFNLQISNNRNVIRCFFVLIRVISWTFAASKTRSTNHTENGTNEISLEPVGGEATLACPQRSLD